MSFVHKLSVQTQLTLAILYALFLSYLISTAASYYFMRQEMHVFRQQVIAQHPEAARDFGQDPGLLKFLLGPPVWRHHPPDHHGPGGPDAAEMPAPPSSSPFSRFLEELTSRLPSLSRMLIALLLALVTGALLSRRFVKPLSALARGAQAYHGGNFTHHIPVAGSNEFAQVAAAMNDMAARVSAQLREMEDDAKRRQQLLADVAHELRGPVTSLRTMSGALDEGLADDPARRARAVQLLVTTTDRLQHLVTDLLELAKLDLRELPMHPQRVDIRELSRLVIQSHLEAATQAGITLHEIETGDPFTLTVDPNRFAQVLDNLLDNAISYAGADAEIRVELAEDDQEACITVSDTGHGIPAEHLPFIFDAFYRAD
ncbi:MAG TPA: HAMP domain-containing sensor histidine kinase, partial [Armatimonadota bacterium]